MQAIQTPYKGYRFRSRTEARWAVFFDAIGITWSYEVEGFNLSGTNYLPDFWIEPWNSWVEIKGPAPTDEEIEKCRLLAEMSGKQVLLIHGEPWSENDKNSYGIQVFRTPNDHWHMSEGWEFGEGRRNPQEIWLVSEDQNAFALNPIPHPGDHKFPLYGSYARTIMGGLSEARSARFEHGESGSGAAYFK